MDESFFSAYLERLETLRRDIRATVDGLPPEAFDWGPGPEMNSIAVLLAHTAGSLRYWIGDIALGEPSARVRAREFETRGLPPEDLLRRLDAVVDYARGGLPRLRLEDLEEERRTSEGKPVTRGWALLHALEHAFMHLGHVQITAQMWRKNSW